MASSLIQKIEKEQYLLERQAILVSLIALGVAPDDQVKIVGNYQWLQAMKNIKRKVPTERVVKKCEVAYQSYLRSLDAGLSNIGKPLKLKDWTRAGQAMASVFQTSAKSHLKD